ncbi:complement C1q subcomponent subunit C-like [Antedon mediterranea]|uniref:complement C1q subcomponent subunit C-like n=1 Tax=Antedon mediterranea TaxID=105859 RepID=UPI003AF7368F
MMSRPFTWCVGILGLCIAIGVTNAVDDNGSANTCNACCHGTPGMPGIPGTHGMNGNQGNQGQKGAPGMKGDDGPIGLPGKAGPVGPKADTGLKGDPGMQAQVNKSAFTAIRTTHVIPAETIITFTSMELNYGDNFNKHNGKFTCQFPGVYYFMLSFGHHDAQGIRADVSLVLNGRVLSIVTRSYPKGFSTQSSGATLQLKTGDQVWLTNGESSYVYGTTARPMTFTGFLLFDV